MSESTGAPQRWHHTRRGAFLVSLSAFLVRAFLRIMGATYRIELIDGGEHLDDVVTSRQPRIFSFWHNRTFLAAPFFLRHLAGRGVDVLVLASHSRDGELVTGIARGLGLEVVRGSSSRGGREAVRAIYRAVTSQGSSPVMIPDGPRGPAYDFKIGTLVLAQLSGAPILPIGFAARRAVRIKSWDRLIIPWPFSRVAVTVGEPQTLAKDLSSEELEEKRLRLEALLDELTLQAEAAVGFEDELRRRMSG